MHKPSLFFLALLCLVISPSLAQDDIPVVAIIKVGPVRAIDLAEQGVLAVFEAYGYENGENIEFRQVDAAGDPAQLPSIISLMIAEEVDLLIPIQAATIAATLEITEQLENPPAVIFSVIQDPYALGLAEDACTKPDYFTGQASGGNNIAVQELLASIRAFDAELDSVAIVYNSNDAGAVFNAALYEEMGADFELQILSQTVTSEDEVLPVLETLVLNGAESILVIDPTAGRRLGEIRDLSIQAQIPVFVVDAGGIYLGATLGVGTDFFQLGANTGRIAVGYLEGEVDLATTGISEEVSVLRALNVDVANEENQVIPDGLLDMMDFYIENGESTELEPALPEMSLDEMRAADAEFIESLQCPREAEATEEAGS